MEDDIESEVVLHHAGFIFLKKTKVVRQEADFLYVSGEVVFADDNFILSFLFGTINGNKLK